MSMLTHTGRGAVSLGGRAIGVALGLVLSARTAAKPLHPLGSVSTGVLRRHGSEPRSGIAWIDEPGEDDVLLRLSRSVGVPPPGPDIPGLAVRVRAGAGRTGDLLFSGTGRGRILRFVILPSWSVPGRSMGTVLPYRSPGGPLLLLAEPRDEAVLDLSWAVGRGAWVRFATLGIDPEAAGSDDAPLSFDPVRNTLPGLEPYPWVRRLREPAYRSTRRHRGLPD